MGEEGSRVQDGEQQARAARAGRTYCIAVSGLPPGPNSRLHPLARYRKCRGFTEEVAYQAYGCVASNGFHAPFEHARVVVTITQRSRRYLMDRDNAYATVKPLVDGLKRRLIADDDPAHIDLEVRQEVGPARGVRLEVTEEVP